MQTNQKSNKKMDMRLYFEYYVAARAVDGPNSRRCKQISRDIDKVIRNMSLPTNTHGDITSAEVIYLHGHGNVDQMMSVTHEIINGLVREGVGHAEAVQNFERENRAEIAMRRAREDRIQRQIQFRQMAIELRRADNHREADRLDEQYRMEFGSDSE